MVDKINRYEFIKKLKSQNLFVDLIASGLMSITVASWFDIYEMFLKEKSVKKVSDNLNGKISDRQIQRIIKFMEY